MHEASEKRSRGIDSSTASRILRSSEKIRTADANSYDRAVVEGELDDRFHQIENRVEMQQFFSRLLKPFFTVADIVERDGRWYSHEPDLQTVESTTSAENVRADVVLIHALTGDFDRRLRLDGNHHNLTFDQNKAVFFDLEMCKYFFRDTSRAILLLRAHARGSKSSEDVRRHIVEKIQRMKKYWESDEGYMQVRSAFESSGVKMMDFDEAKLTTTFDDLFRLLLKRVHNIENAIAQKSEDRKAA